MIFRSATADRTSILAITIGAVWFLFAFRHQFNRAHSGSSFASHAGTLPSAFSLDLISFWQDLAVALKAAQPRCAHIEVNGKPTDAETKFEPRVKCKTRPNLIELSSESKKSLFQSHYFMRSTAAKLQSSLPFEQGSRGIVMTAPQRTLPILLVSLRMLRRTNCALPVEVFLELPEHYDISLCENVLPSLNARCRIIYDTYPTAFDMPKPDRYQWKIFSILFSSFQEVLFLDVDAYPTHDPESLFLHAPFTSHGLVLWPDGWGVTAHEDYFDIAGIDGPPLSTRLSSETGIIMLDKAKHQESLIMMVYYNFYGPHYYYPLLCQNSHGAGDKETFIHAAMAVEAPFYQVKSGWSSLGHTWDGEWKHIALAQHDPIEDFRYRAPHPSDIHPDDTWLLKDATMGDWTDLEISRPRPFFVHHTMQKLDPSIMLEPGKPTWDIGGEYQRMFANPEARIKEYGYDLEKAIWESVVEEGCRMGDELCGELQKYFGAVFGR